MNPESYYACPPVPVAGERFGLVTPGTWIVMGHDVWYRVNEFAFPNVFDVVEELRNRDMTRIIPRLREFAEAPVLKPVTRVVLLHPRAWTDEAADYQRERVWPGSCPRGISHPTEDGAFLGMCCGLYREDVDGGMPIRDPMHHPDPLVGQAEERYQKRLLYRARASGPYVAASRPRSLRLPSEMHDPYKLAIFMEIPVNA